MVRPELKEAALLGAFAFMLREVLTPVTVLFTVLGMLLVARSWRPPRLLRNAMAILVLASYWFTYGKVIDPEVGLNFLTTVVLIKLMEKETERDQYMIFMGLVLLLAAGSLFERTLSYALFFTGAFFVLIKDFYRGRGLSAGPRDLAILFLWILPLTAALFFFVPRSMNPIPFKGSASGPGEIGYTPTVNLSSLSALGFNDAPAFQVAIRGTLPQKELYWRGNTVSASDGWNWFLAPEDRPYGQGDQSYGSEAAVHQSIRLYSREEFLFALDVPERFILGGKSSFPAVTRTLPQERRGWFQRYEVESAPGEGLQYSGDTRAYLRSGLSKKDKEWIRINFPGKRISELEGEVRNFLQRENFSYSLRPGPVGNLREFLLEKKVGLCSHYASALALILRVKGIPARLVSGFMGGSFNRFGNFYLVSQNDAHVWVEALEEGRWRRLDPTEWIAPDRLRLGGEAFMAQARGGVFSKLNFPGLSFLQDLRFWFGQWDFKFYQWLEQVDYHGQEAWLHRLKLQRRWFYFIAPLLLLLFLALYAWGLRRRQSGEGISETQLLWEQFAKKLRQRGLTLSMETVEGVTVGLRSAPEREREKLLRAWEGLLRLSFEERGEPREVRELIKKL